MDELTLIDREKYDYLNYEPLTFKDSDGYTITFYQVPVYDEKGDVITVVSGTYEILDNLVDLYTRAALYPEQPKDLCLKIAETIREFLDDIAE